MSACPRDLADLEPWTNSLERSRARRARKASRRGRAGVPAPGPAIEMLLDPRSSRLRDLAEEEPWQLSLGRSRARRRAAELQFVPTSSRAKRISLGAIAALSVGPTASIASGQSSNATGNPEPATTTENVIVLTEGSEGRQVQLLQHALGGIRVDGIFGPETEAAVTQFQERNGLTADGVVGPQTAGALRGSGSGLTASMASVSPGEEGSTTDAINVEGEGEGEGGGAVQRLQSALKLAVDGEFGPETEAAVRRLQARHGLTVDGVVGPATWSVLGVNEAETLTPPPSALPQHGSHHAAAHVALAEGGEGEGEAGGDAVERLQKALKISPDGEFGPETEAAVRRLQARHGLTVDGVVGPATWTVLGIDSQGELKPSAAVLHSHSAHSSSASAGGGEEEGAVSGNAVERLQKALKISPDGEFGPETEAAVRRLQARHGLTVDGAVGPATWALLGINSEGELKPSSTVLHASESGGESTSSGGSSIVARVIAAGDEIATRPYVWGGGHGSFVSSGYDCSGSVSYALHGGGLLSSPEDSTGLESFGEPGPGRDITIYANSEHAFMVVDGKRFDTVALSETGTRWSSSITSTAGFVARHPAGL